MLDPMDRLIHAARKAMCHMFFLSICWFCHHGALGEEPHHYVFFNRDRERISEASFLDTKALEGAQLKYTWRELDQGKDGYEFGDIRHDLGYLKAKGKKLFIQLQD